MNSRILSLAIVGLGMLSPFVAAQKNDLPLISTNGSAEIKVVPDLADMRFDVEVRNVDLAAARKQQGDRMKKLIAALKAAGIAEKDLKTSQVQIQPVYHRDEKSHSETATVQFFTVSQTVTCTLKDIKKVPDITGEAVNAGATGVGGVQLRTSQLRKYRDEARIMAIRAAREKAQALAAELGVKVGKPQQISENTVQPYAGGGFQNSFRSNAMADGEESSTFAPGTISITAEVHVAFVIE